MTIKLEPRDGIAILTIDRQDAMNSVNTAVSTQLGEALAQADADPEVEFRATQGGFRRRGRPSNLHGRPASGRPGPRA